VITLVKQIEAFLPDVAAFDMEGWGFYRAAADVDCLWIKAVADSGEAQSHTNKARASKQDTQATVTDNAIEFAVLLVREFVRARPAN
jgi:hypothetical protein